MNIERPLPKLLTSAVFISLVGVIVAAFVNDHAPASGGGDGEMLRVPAGSFDMGFEHGYDDERPLHQVQIREFRIDRTEVSNHQFRRFVEATGHLTQAERDGYCWAYVEHADDFQALQGASWRHPQGPSSSIDDPLGTPVRVIAPRRQTIIRPAEEPSLVLMKVNKQRGENPLQAQTIWFFGKMLVPALIVFGVIGLFLPRRRTNPPELFES